MSDRVNTPFTAEHFVAYCLQMVGHPYWYGTCGYKATSSLLSRKAKQYPSHYGSGRTSRYKQDIANREVVCDCIGGAKGYAWTGGGQAMLDAIGTDKSVPSTYGAHGCPDKGANAMFSYAKNKGCAWGTMATLPEVPGLALTKDGHVGYYIGNGWAVEWQGFAYGCVKTQVSKRPWTHWYALPFIDYGDAIQTAPVHTPDTPATEYTLGSRSLEKGAKGTDVKTMQELLLQLGFSLPKYGADGSFGTETLSALKAFQSKAGIKADGIYGTETHAALIFQNFLQGKSRLETEREFAAEGITTAKGCRWVDSNIKVVLTNVTYTGNLLLQKEYITDPITKKRKKNRGELTQYYVEGTHEAIIDRETFDYVQQEMARRKALGPRANKSLNLTCFSGKIRCPHCGINYGHLRPRRGSLISYWVCGSKRKKKVGDGCPVKGAMSEVAIRKCCAEALGLAEFDEAVFTERVDHLEVPDKDRLTFFMKDGTTFTRDCRNTGHQDCWTPEYRAAVSAYRREHGTNPRGKSCFTSKIKCACGSNYQTSYQKLKDGAIRYWRCPEKCCEKGMREDRLRAVCAEVLDTDGFDEAAFTAQVEYISVLADGVLEFHLANGRAVQHSIDLRRSGTKWSEEQRRRFDESIKGLYTPERRQAMSEHMKQLRKERGENWRKE